MSDITKMKVKLNNKLIDLIKLKFYSFDVETTGLNPTNDRIIEIGCCEFINLKPVRQFSTLINAHKYIPPYVSKVNNITNEMIECAPEEDIVYYYFKEFIKDVLEGNAVICAHNANFDMNFLSNTFNRLQISGKLYYIDTLDISKRVLSLTNYKQITVADHLNIPVTNAHRAGDDALVCGKILSKLVEKMTK